MQISPATHVHPLASLGSLSAVAPVQATLPAALEKGAQAPATTTREAFDSFVGQTFYGQMLKSLRSTVGKPAYFHGGRAEEIFREQLDQVLAERFTEVSADQFTGPMFELFSLNRGA